MKNRDYKEFAPGTIAHIYNRGNNREKIFYNQQDYKAFLFRIGLALGFDEKDLNQESLLSLPHSRIRIDSKKGLFRLHSFCLMPNHFHLLLEQLGDVPISAFISKVCTSYAMYMNKKYKRVGHVFQERFKSVVIDNNSQLMWVSAYIHMNPVKEGMVKSPENYKWSSFNDFSSDRGLRIVYKDLIQDIFWKTDFKKETLALSSKEY